MAIRGFRNPHNENAVPGLPGYIELDRRFDLLKGEWIPEQRALNSYEGLFEHHASSLDWSDLQKKRLVVVLGEPGSGKTFEFKARAEQLNREGQCAFYVRLDSLITQPLESLLGSEKCRSFRKHLRRGKEVTFLLDSVDEAKFFRRGDYIAAIDRFKSSFSATEINKIRVFLSSRISEWQPYDDEQELLNRFPLPRARKSTQSPNEAATDSEAQDPIIVVALEALDRDRVKRFVEGQGITNADHFLQALDSKHAWEFARRPIDVLALVEYWTEQGQFGTLRELIEFDVSKTLRPSSRDRDDPLTAQQAREGAEILAAATVLCRKFTFRIPDNTDIIPGALAAPECLPADWQKTQATALLNRPIFDSETYGQIRFHHRRTAEYLTAEWLKSRLQEGCPIVIVEQLLTADINGLRVMRPSVAPVIAWLCIGQERWNDDVRNWVLEAAPQIHLTYGDPANLSTGYKRRILAALVRLFQGQQRIWIDPAPDSLVRLADPGLEEDISQIIINRTISKDLRSEMLQIVRYGNLKGCLSAALEIIASPEESESIKSFALAAIRDVGDASIRLRLADIVRLPSTLPSYLCALICETLFPSTISIQEFVNLLSKVDSVERHGTDLPYYVQKHLESKLLPEQASDLLPRLVELSKSPPHIIFNGRPTGISSRFWWLSQIIKPTLKWLLNKSDLTPQEENNAAEALLVLSQLFRQPDVLQSEKGDDLQESTIGHPAVRRAYFWRIVSLFRQEVAIEPRYLSSLFHHYDVLRAVAGDFEWLVRDLECQQNPRDRELILNMVVSVWNQFGRSPKQRGKIRKAIRGNASLLAIFRNTIAGKRLMRWLPNSIYRLRFSLGDRWWWERRLHTLRSAWSWLRDQWMFHLHFRDLVSGKRVGWLAYLVQEAAGGHGFRWAPDNWDAVRRKRGWLVVWAAKRGCKTSWRRFTPFLPHQKPNPQQTDSMVVVGLAGLQAIFQEQAGEFLSIGGEEARLMTRYAVNELNGFAPWIPDLARTHPREVQDVLTECIEGEWNQHEPQRVNGVISDLVYHGQELDSLVVGVFVRLLRSGEPANDMILRNALTILLRNKSLTPTELSSLCAARLNLQLTELPRRVLWLSAWLQCDAGGAIDYLENVIRNDSNAGQLVLEICSSLSMWHTERFPRMNDPSYAQPSNLRRIIPIIYSFVAPTDDINRVGFRAYSPGARDHAQEFRNGLLQVLANSEGADVLCCLQELKEEPALVSLGDWLTHLIAQRQQHDADVIPWTAQKIRQFHAEFENDPQTDTELSRIVVRRLGDIKHDVERADVSIREDLHPDDDEARFRRWLMQELRTRARGGYTASQEEEVDRQQRPDVRIWNPRVSGGPISIEIKLADRWTGPQLLERLENQLIGQYMRDANARHGIYVLGIVGERSFWVMPGRKQRLTFVDLISILQERASTIVTGRRDLVEVRVIGIDFRTPS